MVQYAISTVMQCEKKKKWKKKALGGTIMVHVCCLQTGSLLKGCDVITGKCLQQRLLSFSYKPFPRESGSLQWLNQNWIITPVARFMRHSLSVQYCLQIHPRCAGTLCLLWLNGCMLCSVPTEARHGIILSALCNLEILKCPEFTWSEDSELTNW